MPQAFNGFHARVGGVSTTALVSFERNPGALERYGAASPVPELRLPSFDYDTSAVML